MIYNNIEESTYYYKYDELKFYFSSQFYLNKFKKEYLNYLKDEEIKMQLKYKCIVYCDEIILLLLYKRIEKRGFKVLYKDKPIRENYYFTMSIDKLSYKE